MKNWWYNFKWQCWALVKYFKIVRTMRPWDYSYVLSMMQFQLNLLHGHMLKKSNEVDESLYPKLNDMRRVIELVNHHIESDFLERLDEKPSWYGKSNLDFFAKRTPEQEEQDKKILRMSHQLEEEEWEEIWAIISKGKNADYGARGWWY